MVTDFGLATGGSTGVLLSVPNRMGTERYAAPEVLEDYRFNKKSDIWALGCILFEVCTGQFAFKSGLEITTFAKLPNSSGSSKFRPFKAEIIGSSPWRINEMVEAMLQSDVDRRPSITDVCERVEAALHSEATIRGPAESPYLYFDEKSLVGTEAPIWRAGIPDFEQIIPSGTYRDHPGFIRRRERILDARRRFLGRFSRVTAWTKVYLGWTIYVTSRPDTAWTYFNAARTDLLEINKDIKDEHPSELVVQAGLLNIALELTPFSQTLRDEFDLLIQKLKRNSNHKDIIAVEQLALGCLVLESAPDGPDRRLELESSISASTQQLGPQHQVTLFGQFLLGCWQHRSGLSEAGLVQMTKTVGEMEEVWGPSNSTCLSSKRMLAFSYLGVDATKAAEILIDILPPSVNLFGPTHSRTQQIARDLRLARLDVRVGDVAARIDEKLASYQLEVEAFERPPVMPRREPRRTATL